MRSQALAITWAFWQRGWLPMLGNLAGMSLLPAIVYTALRHIGADTLAMPTTRAEAIHPLDLGVEAIGLHLGFYTVALIAFCAGLVPALGPVTQTHTLPINSHSLVAWNMVNCIAMVMLSYLVLAAIVNFGCGAQWPYLGPTLFAGAVGACAHAILWFAPRCVTIQILSSIPAAILLWSWLGSRYGSFRGSDGVTMWQSVRVGEAATLLATLAAVYCATVVGFSRDRCNEMPTDEKIGRFLDRLTQGLLPWPAQRERQFQSALGAYFWSEWLRRGLPLPVITLVTVTGILFCSMTPWSQAGDGVRAMAEFAGGGIMLSLLVGMFIGHRRNDFTLSGFEATRPLTDGQLAATILKNTALSVALTAVIWAIGWGILVLACLLNGQGDVLFTELRGSRPLPFGPMFHVVFLSGLGVLSLWTTTSLGVSLGLARKHFALSALLGAFGLVIGTILLMRFAIPETHTRIVSQCIAVGVGVACIAVIVAGFVASLRRSLITKTAAVLSAIGWLVMAGFLCGVMAPATPLEISGVVFVLGLLALPVAPVAAAPLALAWNRHR